MSDQPRASRADAARNRATIVKAAEQVFSLHGVGASLDLIVEAAGIGRATLYRNFADRRALVVALLEHALDRLESEKIVLGNNANTFNALLEFVAGPIAADTALFDYGRVLDTNDSDSIAARRRLHAIFAEPLKQARSAGLFGIDMGDVDVTMLISMIGGVVQGRPRDERRAAAAAALKMLKRSLYVDPH